MTIIDTLYTGLESYIDELEITFIERFLRDPLALPDDYKHHVKAYCVLSHAAIEEYFEEVALAVMLHSVDVWETRRVFNDSLVTLLGHFPPATFEPDGTKSIRSFDYLKQGLEKAKENFSKYVKVDNHGADLKYLQKLMNPIALDVTDDPQLIGSLRSLARERGEFAHKALKSVRATNVLAPEDARNWIFDCLVLCDDIRRTANSKLH